MKPFEMKLADKTFTDRKTGKKKTTIGKSKSFNTGYEMFVWFNQNTPNRKNKKTKRPEGKDNKKRPQQTQATGQGASKQELKSNETHGRQLI